VGAQFLVGLVVEALDGRLLDCAVHALDLAVGPRMPGLGQAMVDVVFGTGILERMPLCANDDETNGRAKFRLRG
jgi:hypothetical protein